jgi:hypothetical protein
MTTSPRSPMLRLANHDDEASQADAWRYTAIGKRCTQRQARKLTESADRGGISASGVQVDLTPSAEIGGGECS